MKAVGVDTGAATFTKTDFYTAHECLLLPYEQALTRQDSTTGKSVSHRNVASLLPDSRAVS